MCFHFPQSAFRQHSNILAFGKNRNKRNRKKKWEAYESGSCRRIEIKDICRPPIMDAKLRSEIYIFSQGDRNKHNRAEKRHQTTMRNGWGSRRRHLRNNILSQSTKSLKLLRPFCDLHGTSLCWFSGCFLLSCVVKTVLGELKYMSSYLLDILKWFSVVYDFCLYKKEILMIQEK